jgi:putative dimethyl sulfoxide reductase chaperone
MNDASLCGRLFALLSSMYLCKPTRESLANWRQLLKDEPLTEAEGLRMALDAIDLGSEQELEDILWEYTRLFIGPHRLPCPPLESVYTSHKRLMMQEAYDGVREFYSRVGIEVGSADVMPDHIGAELNFLAILFDRMVADPEKRLLYEELTEEFLSGHLRNWVPSFTADQEEAAETLFYKALARITREAVT